MQLPFVILALAISLLSLVGHTVAMGKLEYAKHVRVLENLGQTSPAGPTTPSNGTSPGGAPCYQDGVYSAFSAFSSDFTSICSSALGISDVTVTAACATTTT